MQFEIDERSSVIPNIRQGQRERVEHALRQLTLIRERFEGRPMVLRATDSVAWVGGGLSQSIDRTAQVDPVWFVIDDGVRVIASSVEVERIEKELETLDLDWPVTGAAWWDPESGPRVVHEWVGANVISDGGLGIDVTSELVRARLSPCDAELSVYEWFSPLVTKSLEDALDTWCPGESSDYEVAGELQCRLESMGAEGVCVIVGGDDRLRRFRHPLAVGDRPRRRIMGVVVARVGGLHIAVTRFAGETTSQEAEAMQKCRAVDTAVLEAIRPGATWGEVYASLGRAYEDVGRPGEWRKHFQGGPLGYRQREFELSPESTSSPWWNEVVPERVVVSFNPSFDGGIKVEDTILVEAGEHRRLSVASYDTVVTASGMKGRGNQ